MEPTSPSDGLQVQQPRWQQMNRSVMAAGSTNLSLPSYFLEPRRDR